MARATWDEEVSGWISDFVAGPDQLRNHEERLGGLIGDQLLAGWTAGRVGIGDTWCSIVPLLLVFEGGSQLELAWNIREELSVTWDTVDRAVPLRGRQSDCEWRSSQPAPLGDVVGRRLTTIATVETPWFRGEDEPDFSNGLPMHLVAGWSIAGLWMEFGEVGLLVYDVVGDLGLASSPNRLGKDHEIRVTPEWPEGLIVDLVLRGACWGSPRR